ncbi:hypothetical protein [Sphingomonas sp. M1-B02]|uniref:hypothetical protein n=1 Tax=Sphingomonas sp. M1-B02 TaxID=3114300 RepID=UPI00223F6748|nr:hypothetical protein [Sphingomonas sp. S6-11]UZK65120.1 hypothetical protein OKW87_11405 [Sphingomonas sp. S6-11]
MPPPAPIVAAPMPRPPASAATSLTLPPRLPDGSYATPNRDLTGAAAIWHVRAALNVAALGCAGGTLAPAYNQLLKAQRTGLAAAHRSLTSQYGGPAPFDVAMTRIYNYFSQPPAQSGFCAVAAPLLAEAVATPTDAFATFAVGALQRLDRPFVDFYTAYDRYRSDLAAWHAGDAQPHLTVDTAVLRTDPDTGSRPTRLAGR